MLADTAGGAWTFGGSILTFAFPMILFVVVAIALYVAYTRPETVPGRWVHGADRPVSYTPVPGQPRAAGKAPDVSAAASPVGAETAEPAAATTATATAETTTAETTADEPVATAADEPTGTEAAE